MLTFSCPGWRLDQDQESDFQENANTQQREAVFSRKVVVVLQLLAEADLPLADCHQVSSPLLSIR